MGPTAKARTIGAPVDTFGCRRHRRTNQRQYSKLCPPMPTMAADRRNGDFGTSPFFGQLFGANQCLSVCDTKMGVPEAKYNRSHPFCVEVAVYRVGRSRLGALVVDNLASYPHTATFGSSISRVLGGRRHKTKSISLRDLIAPLVREFFVGVDRCERCVCFVDYERDAPTDHGFQRRVGSLLQQCTPPSRVFVLRVSHEVITHKERGLSCKMAERQIMNARQPRPAASFAARSNRWKSNAARSEANSSQNAQRNYERYLALARAEAQIGNTIGAENYYQYAEHYFRSIRSDSEGT